MQHSSLNLHTFDCVCGTLQHLTWTATAGSQHCILLHSLHSPASLKSLNLGAAQLQAMVRQFTLPSLPPTSSFFQDLKLSTLLSPLSLYYPPFLSSSLSSSSLFRPSPHRALHMNVSACGRACGTVWKTGNELHRDKVLSDRAWI